MVWENSETSLNQVMWGCELPHHTPVRKNKLKSKHHTARRRLTEVNTKASSWGTEFSLGDSTGATLYFSFSFNSYWKEVQEVKGIQLLKLTYFWTSVLSNYYQLGMHVWWDRQNSLSFHWLPNAQPQNFFSYWNSSLKIKLKSYVKVKLYLES